MNNNPDFKPISEIRLDGFDREAVIEALKTAAGLFDKDGKCLPVLLVPAHGIATHPPMADDRGKRISGKMMSECARIGTTIFISEAWAKLSHGRIPGDGRFLRPSLDPERVEVIIARVILDEGKREITIMAEIIRSLDCRAELKPWMIMGDTNDGCSIEKPRWKKEEE